MAEIVTMRPVMSLMPCETIKPERLRLASATDIELAEGAIGIGGDLVADGEAMLFLSLHGADGEAMFARLDSAQAEQFVYLLTRKIDELSRALPVQHRRRAN